MSSILDLLTGELSGTLLKQISSQLGADENVTRNVIPQVVGLLLNSLARNANDQSGAEALSRALADDHDGGILDDIGGFLGNYAAGDGEGILGHVFGNNRADVEQQLSGGSGLNADAVSGLLTMIAPLVMGALGKARKEDGLDAQGVAKLLRSEQSSGLGGFAGAISGATRANLPGAAAGVSAGTAEGRTEYYVVQSGDTLSKIAYRFYGNGDRYPEIFEANRDILKDPNLIYPGQRLKIPNVKK